MTFTQITATDALGYSAALLVLLTFSLRSITALRSAAIISNLLFIAYALASSSTPILVLHTTLLPLNIWRLLEMRSNHRPAVFNPPGPAKSRAPHPRRRLPAPRVRRVRPSVPHR